MSARLTAFAILINFLPALAAAQNTPAAGTVRYRLVRVEGMATVRELQKTHGAEGFLAILHINRWLRLAEDVTATTVTLDEIQRALEPHKAMIEERATARAQWLAQKEK